MKYYSIYRVEIPEYKLSETFYERHSLSIITLYGIIDVTQIARFMFINQLYSRITDD